MKPIGNDYLFPRWMNFLPLILLAVVGGGGFVAHVVFGVVANPNVYEVGYAPTQPIPFSHKLHAGELGLDCLYCHGGAEKSSVAGVPATDVCMKCHESIKTDSLKLKPLFESHEKDKALEWVRVHRLPDYVHFPHKAHVQVGLACQECHGEIERMEKVSVASPMSMGWCLNCHRKVRGVADKIPTLAHNEWENVDETTQVLFEAGHRMKDAIDPPTNCSGCHQ